MTSKPNRDELRAAIRESGLRCTPSRLAVLDLMHQAGLPLSHGEVSGRLELQGWDPATLYRNLTDLCEVGLVKRTDMGDHVWRFELVKGDHDAKQHPHFVCTECGVVECLPVIDFVPPRSRAPRSVRSRQVEVSMRGRCDTCA